LDSSDGASKTAPAIVGPYTVGRLTLKMNKSERNGKKLTMMLLWSKEKFVSNSETQILKILVPQQDHFTFYTFAQYVQSSFLHNISSI
jgi:folate-binding Fe-S cluster repair protein YgfZ